MSQYGMVIDLEKCVGCHACSVACRAEWDVPVGVDSANRKQRRNWVERLGPDATPHGLASTYYVGLCNHCDSPVCVESCPADKVNVTFSDPKTGQKKTVSVSATWKDPFNGTVQIDKERCLGCGACADSCPYTARYVFEEDGTPKADKCTLCVERTAVGLEPACVQTCLAEARICGDLNDKKSPIARYVAKGAVRLESAKVKIGPNVRYYGKKKDISLLTQSSTPLKMAEINHRRIFMARMVRPSLKAFNNNSILGLLGTIVAGKSDHV